MIRSSLFHTLDRLVNIKRRVSNSRANSTLALFTLFLHCDNLLQLGLR